MASASKAARRERLPTRDWRAMNGRPLVVVLTAGMGAGHDRVGRELASRLDRYGVATKIVDTAELLPRGWGAGLTALYKFMACRAQWLYEITFRLEMCPQSGSRPRVLPLSLPAERRLSALVERERPALVLSTFHLCSQIAGRMREQGALDVPVVSYVLDFFVHGMWAHGGVDAHLLLHRSQVPQLLARGGRRPVVCGPVVRPAFTPEGGTWDRFSARRSLGVGERERCVLI
ncbi:MAG: MGDG synthase family glycosyltransferase, partial [Acidimicrobiales bacterium]